LITCLFFLHVFSKGNKIVSVCGGKLGGIYVLHSYNSLTREDLFYEINNQLAVAILITGSIQTWSTVLDWMKCNTEELAEARLKSFKDKVKLKKHSIAFMFSYADSIPSCKKYQSRIELKIFERLFPKVPLVGCYGYELFGKTTIVDEVKEEGE